MGTYQGSATVFVGAAEYEVEADLRSAIPRTQVKSMAGTSSVQGLVSWGGTLETDDDAAAWEMLHGGVLRISLRDARDGEFIVSGGTVGGSLRIKGNGSPPF